MIRSVPTLLLAALALFACDSAGYEWDAPPVTVVVSKQSVAEECPQVGSRVACYVGGKIYIQPSGEDLPEGVYTMEIPTDWNPPPWPSPKNGMEQMRAMESGRAILEYNGIPADQIFNRAAHLAHEVGHHVGLTH